MGIKEKMKELWFYITTNPNSPEGLRHRADRLMKKEGLSPDNPYVSYLLKLADQKEEEQVEKEWKDKL